MNAQEKRLARLRNAAAIVRTRFPKGLRRGELERLIVGELEVHEATARADVDALLAMEELFPSLESTQEGGMWICDSLRATPPKREEFEAIYGPLDSGA